MKYQISAPLNFKFITAATNHSNTNLSAHIQRVVVRRQQRAELRGVAPRALGLCFGGALRGVLAFNRGPLFFTRALDTCALGKRVGGVCDPACTYTPQVNVREQLSAAAAATVGRPNRSAANRISVQKFLHGSVVAAFHAFLSALIDM